MQDLLRVLNMSQYDCLKGTSIYVNMSEFKKTDSSEYLSYNAYIVYSIKYCIQVQNKS